jgi:hypothetical protein
MFAFLLVIAEKKIFFYGTSCFTGLLPVFDVVVSIENKDG